VLTDDVGVVVVQTLLAAALDILVFADQMSEVNSYMYSFGRYAAVQVGGCVRDTMPREH
jgi:hypothetical protein